LRWGPELRLQHPAGGGMGKPLHFAVEPSVELAPLDAELVDLHPVRPAYQAAAYLLAGEAAFVDQQAQQRDLALSHEGLLPPPPPHPQVVLCGRAVAPTHLVADQPQDRKSVPALRGIHSVDTPVPDRRLPICRTRSNQRVVAGTMALMRIAVLGTGMVGQAVAARLVEVGHEVMMGARDANNPKAAEFAARTGGAAGTFADAASHGELVVNATTGTASLAALAAAGGAAVLDGKVLVDLANPLDFSGGAVRLAVADTDSLGAQIQRAYPGAAVVK